MRVVPPSQQRGQQERSLRTALQSVLSDSPNRAAVSHVVHLVVQMARAVLLGHASHGRLAAERFGLDVDDLATDCVANLFERDEAGRFSRLIAYFCEELAALDDARLMYRLRCLTFGAVEDGIFRRYGEHDPVLARLIRSLRRASERLEGVHLERRFGRLHVVVEGRESDAGALLTADRIEAHLMARIQARDKVADYLGYIVELMRHERDIRPEYSMVGLALAIRSALTQLHAEPAPQGIEPTRLEDVETEVLLVRTVAQIEQEYHATYVGTGKVEGPTFEAYCRAIETLLVGTYRGELPRPGLYRCLKRQLPGLDRETYRALHRTRCEYLLRLVRERLLNELHF